MFHLCLAGLAPHPDHLEVMLTGDQLAEWEAFDRLEPIGGYKQDFRFAQLCNLMYVLAHALGGDKRATSKIQDFMPWWFLQYLNGHGKPEKGQSADEMKRNLMEWARQHNRAVEHKAKRGREKQ